MLIATWNVNGIRARIERLLEWLDVRKPDVVCLQELKADDENFPAQEIEAAGYSSVAACQKAWNGVAVLARDTVELKQAGLPGLEEMGARAVTAEVGDLSVVSVYVPNGKSVEHDDYEMKLQWLGELRSFATREFDPADRVVIAGDFNIVPTDLDSYDAAGLAGTVFHTERERAAYRELIDLGFVDLFRECEPDAPGFSWWDYRGGNFHKNLGLRIDLILGSAPVAAATEKAWIDRDFRKGPKPSDHAPLIAELRS